MNSDKINLLVHTSKQPETPPADKAPRQHTRPRLHIKTKLSFHERLLRNSMLACALLLGILTLGKLDAPWAQKAAGSIERALTMEIDLDASLGQLSFVRRIMPESALVFLNLSGNSARQLPAEGTLTHVYSEDQPWLLYSTVGGTEVCAAQDGTVSAVSMLSDGSWGVLIDHGGGLESVTACLAEVSIRAGDRLARGDVIGLAGSSLYLELRDNGTPCDPAAVLGL